MEQYPIQIAQIIQKNGLVSTNQGLMQGNLGICIFFYHLARNTNNPVYRKIADDLLDNVFINMEASIPTNFENGLAGIGWGIEYLIQNNFSDGNSDEILEEVDDKIYKLLNENNIHSFDLDNGLTGYLFYLIYRLKNKKTPFSMAFQINRELFISTINIIDELVTIQFPTIVKETQFDLFWRFPVILLGLNEALKLNIYNDKIVCMFKQWLPYFEAYIPSLHINRIYLAVVLKQIYSHLPVKRLEKQIQILLFATDFEVLKTETNHFSIFLDELIAKDCYNISNIRYGWPGVALLLNYASNELHLDWPNHQLIGQTFQTITKKHKIPFDNILLNIEEQNFMQYSLTLGLSGIGLIELLKPGILTGTLSSG